jgi:serine/threonine protein phosphatase PrpC
LNNAILIQGKKDVPMHLAKPFFGWEKRKSRHFRAKNASVFVVADGAGGMGGGKCASQVA